MAETHLNTNEPPTVAEVIAFLRGHPVDWIVRGYEGEGGAWIIVESPND